MRGKLAASSAALVSPIHASNCVPTVVYTVLAAGEVTHLRNSFIVPMVRGCAAKVPMTYDTRSGCSGSKRLPGLGFRVWGLGFGV